MLRFVFMFVLAIHGAIHLLGFLKGFQIADISQLTASISKERAVIWLITALIFLCTAIFYFLELKWWWIPSVIALICSQILIILYWQDAKYGSIANIIILAVTIIGIGKWNFDLKAADELDKLLNSNVSSIHQENNVQTVPASVEKWLNFTKVKEAVNADHIYLKQSGRMRLEQDSKWMDFKADQWFTINQAGFLWNADVGTNGFVQFSGKDKYINGKGQMLIKLYSLFTVVNKDGREIDKGVAVRYLSEIVWFPSAALSPFISWKEVDENTAIATLKDGVVSVDGTFTFNDEGKVIAFEADRFYEKNKRDEKWFIEVDENSYKEINGMMIPTKASVTWKLAEGDFKWLEVDILSVKRY